MVSVYEILDNLIRVNKSLGIYTVFDGNRSPKITLENYVDRLIDYGPCRKYFVIALIYLSRINLVITKTNVHRLLLTSLVIACKMWDDTHLHSAYYAKVGGITVGELNQLEVEFLFRINFDLVIDSDSFEMWDVLID